MNSVKETIELKRNIEELISTYNEWIGSVWYKLELNIIK